MNFETYFLLKQVAKDWLDKNPERLTSKEKVEFEKNLQDYIAGAPVLDDEVYDFLIQTKIVNDKTRHEEFANYLVSKYNQSGEKSVLDVGAGRMCHLSRELTTKGFEVYAMDPKIRLTNKEINRMHLMGASRSKFICDDFANNSKGTDVNNFDLLVGLEPCMATEHIIRQGLNYDKPFEVLLCYQNHDALSGEKFKSPESWYEHLNNISREVDIVEVNNSFIATNNSGYSEPSLEI